MTAQQITNLKQAVRNADEKRRNAGLSLARGAVVIQRPTENSTVLCEIAYEKYFDLGHCELVQGEHQVAIMADGKTSCDCPDSSYRHTTCRHAVAAALVLLTEEA
jgi:uncharacterized Zn finger protein